MPLISDIHIATLQASMETLRGCDPLKPLTPQQVFNVVHSYRKVLDEFEGQATKDLAKTGVAHAQAG